MRNFLLLCVYYIPLLMVFNIELLRKKNIWGELAEVASAWLYLST